MKMGKGGSLCRGVVLEELKSASVVLPAKLLSYDSDSLKFQSLGDPGVLSAKYSPDPTWNPGRFIHANWPPKDEKVTLTGEWPPAGAEVLVVVDKDHVISLFAWPQGDSYRFWSPIMTGSVASFDCKPLGAPIDNRGWDGCLASKSQIVTKGMPPSPPRLNDKE